ncbi:hypothetical protein EDD85DRAFT_1029642 [Armillaria nabsnona]|nr:hypothetical protein EDD85DRAFT_1029642 [Armillaria nabsnona]
MSSTPSIPIPIADIPTKVATTLGALFIGATIAAVNVCYGITILQTFVYYKINPNDPWIFRYSVRNSKPSHLTSAHLSYVVTPVQVALLLILDTLHVALGTHALYFYLIKSFGNHLVLLSKFIWSFLLQLPVNVLVNSGVQAETQLPVEPYR